VFVDLEIIFNNTYSYIQFTYKVPSNYGDEILVGDIVKVPFRNGTRFAIVLNINSKNSYSINIKNIKSKIGHIDKLQLKYLEQLAISNNINIGMLLYKYIDYKLLSKQSMIEKGSTGIYKNSDLSLKLRKANNVIFTSSLLEAKKLSEIIIENGKTVDFYQKTGGSEEFANYWNNVRNFENIIILSVNFEKILIDTKFNFHFYNSNNYSFNLPNLNNINIVEASIIKYKIFKGNFYYYSEFPSLEFFNKVNQYFLEIPPIEFTYIYGNNLKECIQLFDRMFNERKLNIFSFNSDIQTLSKKHKILNNNKSENLDAIILYNPTISHNGILSSNRLINFVKKVTYYSNKNIEIIIFSTSKINLNKQLTEDNITKWAQKEQSERAKYGPNINIKIFKVTTDIDLDITKYTKYLIGPKFTDGKFEYELKIQINKKYNYNEIMSIFSILKKFQLERVRSL